MSSLSIGVVGLPNVGKSTLFQALTAVAIPAENYPFCTIDPNVGVVEVPDERLHAIAELVRPRKVTPAVVEFVDIAGLVRGASRGEGLGNKFLQHIREVDAIAHVVRCFDDPAVVRVGDPDPTEERRTVELELALADMATVGRALERAGRRARSGDAEAAALVSVLGRLGARLERGEPAAAESLTADEEKAVRSLNLLTRKPVLYVENVSEQDLTSPSSGQLAFEARLREEHPAAEALAVSARFEAEIGELEEVERLEFLSAHGLAESGLNRLIRAAYRLLGLHTFFTAGEKEVRAWTLRIGATAPEAAGEIHSDFERGFIRAETISCADFLEAGSLKRARELGMMRSEGRDYVVRDGDVILFRSGL
ncbi:MAG: redox-regulated ATPase YchF [Gemmatimonadota bacterium]